MKTREEAIQLISNRLQRFYPKWKYEDPFYSAPVQLGDSNKYLIKTESYSYWIMNDERTEVDFDKTAEMIYEKFIGRYPDREIIFE